MITIVKGNEKIVCSYGTYENQFKNLGYRLASEEKKEAAPKTASSLKDKEAVEEENEKLSEKYGLKSKKSTTTKKKEDK